jgi:hypothetical protein
MSLVPAVLLVRPSWTSGPLGSVATLRDGVVQAMCRRLSGSLTATSAKKKGAKHEDFP